MKNEKPLKVKESDSAIPAMESLKQHPGWKMLTEVLQNNIKSIEETILDSDDSWTPEKLTKFRDMRYFEKKLVTLPDTIIAAFSHDEQPTNDIMANLDPYKD